MQQSFSIAVLLLAGCIRPNEAQQQDSVANEVAAPAGESGAPDANVAATGDEGNVSACLVQDGERIAENAIRAIGTEPFWGAAVEGRCVTYSTPDDQDGTRIWTKFSGSAENGRWTGALDGKPFVMVTNPQEGCSDGMSDNRYPIAVTLTVRGEERRGCAEPTSQWEKRRPA